MAQRGYEGTSIAAISSETGLPNSSIYWHFESKAAILAAVMERGAARFFEQAIAHREAGATPRDRLRASFTDASRALESHADFLRLLLLLLLTHQDEQVSSVVRRVRAEGRARIHEVIKLAYIDEGEDRATQIADSLADFGLASFDGTFIASQFNPELIHTHAMHKLADAIASLGDQLLRPLAAT